MKHRAHRYKHGAAINSISLLVVHLSVLRKVFQLLLPKDHRRISSVLDASLVLMFMH